MARAGSVDSRWTAPSASAIRRVRASRASRSLKPCRRALWRLTPSSASIRFHSPGLPDASASIMRIALPCWRIEAPALRNETFPAASSAPMRRLNTHVPLDRSRDLGAGSEVTMDQSGNQVRVQVAHSDQRHVARDIPVRVVLPEVLWGDGLDALLGSDGESPSERCLVREPFVDVLLCALLGARARALFFQDNLPLALDLVRNEAQTHGHVGEVEQAFVDGLGLGIGQGELIRGLLETREGILVAAEGNSKRLEEGDQGAGREVGRAVEGHVLEVMGEAAGRVGLVCM